MRCLLVLCLLVPHTSFAKVQIPCLVKNKRGRWVAQKKTECIQYTKAEQLDTNKKLLKLKWYMTDYTEIKKKSEANYQKLDKNWQRTEILWSNTLKSHREIKVELKNQAQYWRDAFQKLQKERTPPKKLWYESRVLWLSVGIVAGIATTSAVAYVVVSATTK